MSSLIHLVRKDLLLLQRYIWLLCIYAVVFSGFVQSDSSPLYGMLPGMVLILALNADMRLPSQQFLVNLPVRRSFLVLSKYVSAFALMLVAFAFCMLLNAGADLVHGQAVTIHPVQLLSILLTQILFMAIYIPLYYWLGLNGAQYLNVAMIIVVMIGSQLATDLLSREDTLRLSEAMTAHPAIAGLLGVCVAALAVVISFGVSNNIFARRDL
ncbi:MULTISPECIES: ABC-2 transporter permease [Paenibacillus]|jgi:ABC-2 type transport system permease protein|uniref:ABC-2 transporter permease n=1 Tax=Paenibacillus TaxID=44249 RepID=UPI00073F2F48|nr:MULTISPECIES: ABC-2 transporter permease [Paenibacillus]MDU4698399.1 ABC-2 transporter permease [Paenibacillus sp.]